MGVGTFKLSSKLLNKSPNPDPKNFKILDIFENDTYTLVIVNYPGCNTFEGNKILIFEGWLKSMILNTQSLDPHFTNDNDLVLRIRCDERANKILKWLFNFELNFDKYREE